MSRGCLASSSTARGGRIRPTRERDADHTRSLSPSVDRAFDTHDRSTRRTTISRAGERKRGTTGQFGPDEAVLLVIHIATIRFLLVVRRIGAPGWGGGVWNFCIGVPLFGYSGRSINYVIR